MGLFSKLTRRTSDKNGEIIVWKEFLLPWQVSVGDTGQTTVYTHEMWVDAFKRFRKQHIATDAKKILMLGLGAGGEIATIHKYFPDCTLTVVEYDEAMVSLAKELQFYKPHPFPTVLVGDAKDVVHTINDTFDLIILDLFLGEEPSPLGNDPVFIQQLKTLLSPTGVLLINVYKRGEYLEVAKKIFSSSLLWMFRLNHLGAFWPGE
jgi:spermidine synthase